MNKFFRLVSMFAIAGATFAYTSCTDYSEDINEANERIDAIKGDVETLKPIKDQVVSLNSTVGDIKAAQTKAEASIADLQTALKALQDKHAADIAKLEKDYAAADAALKSEIQGKIDALAKTHADDVKAINTSIDALKADVTALQAKATEVEKVLPTLATKKELKELEDASNEVAKQVAAINTTIGTLQGDLEVAQKNITALQNRMTQAETDIASMKGDITDLQTAVKDAKDAADKAQKTASDAQTAADKAKEDASNALGEIKILKEALDKYATVSALNAAVKQLEKVDSTLQADKFDTKDFDSTFAGKLKDVIGDYAEKSVLVNKIAALESKDSDLSNEISGAVDSLNKKITKAENDLKEKIDSLDAKVGRYITEVNNRFDTVLGIIAGRLSSIAFVPAYYYDGVPAILFETIAYNPLEDDKENEVATVVEADGAFGEDSEYANVYKNFASALATAKYRLNPRTVGPDCADFSFVGDKADYVYTRATAPEAPVSIVGVPVYDSATGYVTFSVKKNEKLNVTDNTNKNLDIVALKAVLKKGLTEAEAEATDKPEVYSDYTHVNEIAYSAEDLAISDSLNLATKSIERAKSINGHEYAKTFTAATKQDPVYEMPYDKPFDLGALVATCISTDTGTFGLEKVESHVALDLAKYNLEYNFSVAQTPYNVQSEETTTDQQTVIECTDAENGIYEVISTTTDPDTGKPICNKEAIGRTPIVRVDLKHGDNIVTRAFIKLLITVEKEKDITVNQSDKPRSITLKCPEDTVDFKFSEERLRKEVYRVFNISHEEFWNIYQFGSTEVTIDGTKNTAFPQPVLASGVSTDGKATKKITWNFTHKDVGAIGGAVKVVVGKLTLTNKLASSALPMNITFKFEANFSLPDVSIKLTKNEIFWKDGMYQVNVNVPEAVDSDASNCQFYNAIGEQAWTEFVVKNVPCKETGKFVIDKVFENGKWIPYDMSTQGVKLEIVNNVTYIKLDKTNADVKAALNSDVGLMAELKYEIKLKSGDVVCPQEGYFVVFFKRPLDLNLPEGLSVKDAVTGGDKVDFDHRDLLTDWRGYAVLKDVEVPSVKNWFEWVKVCGKEGKHEIQYIPETQEVETPAKLDVEYQTITIKTGSVYYSATIQLYNSNSHGHWTKYKAFTAMGRSATEAIENALTIARTSESNGKYFVGADWKYKYEVENVKEDTASSSIEFESVKSVNYTPAKYKTVPGYWQYADCTAVPTENGDYAGQVIGCYEWTLKTAPDTEVVPGQYWNYYGPISDVVLDLDPEKVTTNLPGGKLPAKAILTQTGTTVTYYNVESPINHEYVIGIPAKVTYGWGTLNGTLNITVNPVSTE